MDYDHASASAINCFDLFGNRAELPARNRFFFALHLLLFKSLDLGSYDAFPNIPIPSHTIHVSCQLMTTIG